MAILHLTQADWSKYTRFYRANLINGITGYKPAMLIGTCDAAGKHNLAIFSSVVHLGADPALIGFIQRPVGVSGDTFRNISATGVYTINHVHTSFVEQAHYTSARFESSVSEFEACRLTPEFMGGFAAPFVQESQIKLGMELVEVIPITHNDTRLVIGRLQHLVVSDHLIGADGNIDLHAAGSICISGLESYHQVSPLHQFPYAKVENLPDFSGR